MNTSSDIAKEIGYPSGLPSGWSAKTVGLHRIQLSTPGHQSPPQLSPPGWAVAGYKRGWTCPAPGVTQTHADIQRIFISPYRQWQGGEALETWQKHALRAWQAKVQAKVQSVVCGSVKGDLGWGKWEGAAEPVLVLSFVSNTETAQWLASWLCLYGGEEQDAVLLTSRDNYGGHSVVPANWEEGDNATKIEGINGGQPFTFRPDPCGQWLFDLITRDRAREITANGYTVHPRHVFELERREA